MPALPKTITIFWDNYDDKREMDKLYRLGDKLTVSAGQLRRRHTSYVVTAVYSNSVTMTNTDIMEKPDWDDLKARAQRKKELEKERLERDVGGG